MSTRSKAKLAAVAPSHDPPNPRSKKEKKPKSARLRKSLSVASESEPEKENKVKSLKRPAKPTSTKKVASQASASPDCTCGKGDDGSPMVYCEECGVWYHFSCVNISEREAEDINIYVCPSCTKKTGRKTAMSWEGPEAVEEVGVINATPKPAKKPQTMRIPRDLPPESPTESEDNMSSEDEYEEPQPKAKDGKTRRLSVSSDSDSDASGYGGRSNRNRPRKRSSSPAQGLTRLKRKGETQSQGPSAKRKKSSAAESNPADDPTRKYCLGKLEDLFRDIFLRYPHVRNETHDDEHTNQTSDASAAAAVVQKAPDELTEEEKSRIVDNSKKFADELEKCIFEIYSEPDKNGNPSAASKYKNRFRMLQFNLSKSDRVVVHRRIASGLLTPKEISVMSSTDLANEETKQSIIMAEKEALEHSILTPTTVPRAKITHKGLEDIEDIHGNTTSLQEQERLRIEEEERRERERLARLRTQRRQRTESLSVPPESPLVANPTAMTWGAPPPVPQHASESPIEAVPPGPSFSLDKPDFVPPPIPEIPPPSTEPELKLEDFINIDDEAQPAETTVKSPQAQMVEQPPPPPINTAVAQPLQVEVGKSPFTQIPTTTTPVDTPRKPSFNLDALWSGPPRPEKEPEIQPAAAPVDEVPSASVSGEQHKDIVMEPDTLGADDQDFDMFLEEKEAMGPSPEVLQAAFEATPQVWQGKIMMPLDSTVPQEVPVVARQMGGRSLGYDSPLWKTLFPSDIMRIDGRVPVDSSAKFLTQMRLNVTKELIAVAFSPSPSSSDISFKLLSDFLIAKGRHGLVFPWGHRPKENTPGREMYIVPLISSDPLPDFIELLDGLSLPKIRTSNYLIGIWILGKGKLVLPHEPAAPAPLQPTIPQLPPNIQLHNLQNLQLPQPSTPNAPPIPSTSSLAAEVATLTPEQIQLMIRTLTSNPSIGLTAGAAATQVPQPPFTITPAPPPPQGAPPHQPGLPHPQQQQPPPWPPHAYPGVYPPPHAQVPPPHPGTPPQMSAPYDRRDHRTDGRPPQQHDGSERGGRSWRGRQRNRGRGDFPHKPVDSGWPRRPRAENGGAGGDPQSPTRRW